MSAHVDAAMTAATAEEVAEVRLLRPRPGDVLVIRLKERLSGDDFAQFTERLEAHFDGSGIKAVVLDPDAELDVVRKDND